MPWNDGKHVRTDMISLNGTVPLEKLELFPEHVLNPIFVEPRDRSAAVGFTSEGVSDVIVRRKHDTGVGFLQCVSKVIKLCLKRGRRLADSSRLGAILVPRAVYEHALEQPIERFSTSILFAAY